MDDIHAVVFPLGLGFGVRGGPRRVTQISTSISGYEQRNTNLSQSRRRWDAGAGVKSTADLEILIAFFEARMGQLYGFLFTDPLDHKSCALSENILGDDQTLVTGDGVQTRFTLTKTYADAAGEYKRRIMFPEQLSVHIDGSSVDFTWDETACEIFFETPPPDGALITAGFEFHTPVRFDTPALDISLETFGAGQAVNIPLIEVLPYAR